MDATTPAPDDIRKLQDTTVTLRMNIPAIYKKLLLKECELEHQKIVDTDICVPKQPIHELNKLERIQRQELPLRSAAQEVQEVHQMLNVLDKLFPISRR
ncbi:uncharacterized protein LOC131284082 [Anopheles ziemanni]|uniref:uncharacterized protein LOC131272639 n=1 Tax=Anopheles coustani TaxID=139045 RepID=UPI0026594DF2|nr:uncharacterized protein LOC131272639 [Anopheles coustani]XP_058168920.1 uncharacterized protein LOC131284082 [Anopheles ziemanni]